MQNQATYYTNLGATDYHPFGWEMPGRQYFSSGSGNYRFGYQGEFSEEDDETGWNSFELRSIDTRLGRWMSVDPYRQFYSPYISMGNNPINGVDPDGGLFGKWRAQRWANNHDGYSWQGEDGRWYAQYATYEGGVGKGFGYQGVVLNGNEYNIMNFQGSVYGNLTLGLQWTKDKGTSGYTLNLASATLFEIDNSVIVDKEGINLDKQLYYIGKDGKIKFGGLLGVESNKAKIDGVGYNGSYNFKTNKVNVEGFHRLGKPMLEYKETYSIRNGSKIISLGSQEEMSAAKFIGGLIGYRAQLNISVTPRIK